MKTVFLVLFSLYFWTVSFIWMAFVFLATFITVPIFTHKRICTLIPSPGFAFCLRLGFTRLKKVCDPAFDPQRPSVFCFNHTNLLDAHLTSAVIPNAFGGLMHSWQFWIPIYGWVMWLSKGIPVGRKPSKKNLQRITAAAKKRAAWGLSILVFPEGHRTQDGKVHAFQKGVFRMAREAGYPVVPVACRGSFAINQTGSFLFRPGKTISAWVGPQYETKGLSEKELGELKDHFQRMISDYVETGEPPKNLSLKQMENVA